jgi:hypothetical protein
MLVLAAKIVWFVLMMEGMQATEGTRELTQMIYGDLPVEIDQQY